ncbi:hypothetical protein FJZ28_04845 [Candidatus Peregrinibacteria bacterium]|nr:hypothetical protein [Candidatus Peregrinibacteria bacterium]
MRRTAWAVTGSLALLAFSGSTIHVHAEAGTATGSTMSGVTLEDLERMRIEEMWNERRMAVKGFWAAMMNARKELAAHASQQAIRREKRSELIAECRKDIRAANRDTLFKETLRCFRALLTGELEIARKEKQAVTFMAGASDAAKADANSALQNAMDALSTVISAVDAGVYGSKEDLEETKRNLNHKYRTPVHASLVSLRLSRRSLWITHLLVKLREIQEDETLSVEVAAALADAIECFEHAGVTVAGNPTATLLTESATVLRNCGERVRETEKLYKEFIQQNAGSGAITK